MSGKEKLHPISALLSSLRLAIEATSSDPIETAYEAFNYRGTLEECQKLWRTVAFLVCTILKDIEINTQQKKIIDEELQKLANFTEDMELKGMLIDVVISHDDESSDG